MSKVFDVIAWIALVLVIVGALNWLFIGIWEYDLVAEIFGAGADATRAVYIVVGGAAVYLLGFALITGFSRESLIEGPRHLSQH